MLHSLLRGLSLVMQLSAEIIASGDDVNLSVLKTAHPSRMIAFHHFCTCHLVPLYEYLYNSRDFSLSLAPLMPDGGPLEAAKVADRGQNVTDLVAYGKQQLPIDIFSMLLLEPLEHLFVFYSELSMNPSLSRYRGDDMSPLALEKRKAAEAEMTKQKELAMLSLSAARRQGKGRRSGISLTPKLPIELRAKRATSIDVSSNKEEIEKATNDAWVSVGVFIRMLRELGILPGFLSLEAAKSIAMISSSGGSHAAAAHTEEQGEGEAGRPASIKVRQGAFCRPSFQPSLSLQYAAICEQVESFRALCMAV